MTEIELKLWQAKAAGRGPLIAEIERLREALREASEELDAAGCQVAASNAHRAANASPGRSEAESS